jgi:hypothetical protein
VGVGGGGGGGGRAHMIQIVVHQFLHKTSAKK